MSDAQPEEQANKPEGFETNNASLPIEEKNDPGIKSVYQYLLYGMSLPERTLRSTSAMIGGVLRESSELLVPQAFRSSRSYSIFVQQGLDFLSENIGGVESQTNSDKPSVTQVEGFVARKAVGNFVELAGFATLHISPLTVLAIVSDLAYGSQTYLRELSLELKKEGVIASESTIDSTADLLDAISNASGVTAEAFDLPPISVDGFKETVTQTRTALNKIDPTTVIPKHEIERLWKEMRSVSEKENVNLLQVSGALSMYSLNQMNLASRGALSTVKVAGNLFEQHIFRHYSDGVTDILSKGFYQSLSDSSRPYIDAVWSNFSTERPTLTEDLLSGRTFGRAWGSVQGWFTKEAIAEQKETLDSSDGSPDSPES